jgi:hypothetical protein
MSQYPLTNPVNKPFVPIFWTGASGTRYEFQLAAIGAIDFYAVAGVYIFCKPSGIGGNYWAVYVGETDSFRRRLNDEIEAHHAIPSIRNHGATHISSLVVSGDRANRLYVETDLRNALNPPCNKQ